MGFNYEIIGDSYDNLLDGKYKASLAEIEEKIDQNGMYVAVDWKLPGHGDRIHGERFYIGHNDLSKRQKAVAAFDKFVKQMTGKNKGDYVVRSDLVGKEAFLIIKNNIADNGNVYVNVVNRIPIIEDGNSENNNNRDQYGAMAMPQKPIVSSEPLNDEVPF